MNKIFALLVAAGLASCGPAEDERELEPGPEAGEETALVDVPEEVTVEALSKWNVHLDEATDDPAGFQFEPEGAGFLATTGPAGIAWRSIDLVQGGDFTATATFEQLGAAPGHREGYGVFVGGRNLEFPDQAYTYFLIRSTGEYLIKRREGAETPTLVDWTSHPAILSVSQAGEEPTNTLTVRVNGEQVEFLVNDATVHTLSEDQVEPYGMAGVRVNHNLQARVSGWTVTGAQVGQ